MLTDQDHSFVCYRCRIGAGVTEEERQIGSKDEAISCALQALRQLCTFRRAICYIYVRCTDATDFVS